MSQPAREYFSAQVSGDQLEVVLTALLAPDFGLPEESREETILLSGRLEAVNKQRRDNTLAPEEADRERNRIRSSLLSLVAALPAELMISPALARKEKRLRYRWAASLGLYLLVAGLTLFFLFQPQRNFRIEGELTMDRLSFTHQQGEYDLEGADLTQARITDYRSFRVEADSLRVDVGLTGNGEVGYRLPDGELEIEVLPDIPGLGVNLLTPVRLESLKLPKEALLTLEPLTGSGGPVRLLVEQMDSISSTFSYLGQVDIETEEVTVSGISGPAEWAGPAGLRVFGPAGRRNSMVFRSLPGLLGLELYPRDSLTIGGKNLMVSKPTFFRKEGDVVRPTILGGKLVLQELDNPPMQTLEIREGESLALTSDQSIEIRQLRLMPDGIHIAFTGEMDKIETGAYFDLRNPLRIEWLWHNHRLLLIAMGLLVFGMIFFLPGPIRGRIMDFVRHMRAAKG